jgi:sulfonate transport system ATP-binding protein
MTRGSAISLRGVSKSFGSLNVLHEIDLDIAAGSFTAIIGRSGCGKSTLLRLIAGLDDPTTGEIKISGNGAKPRLMFQDARLLPWARTLDNVEVGLGIDRGTPAGRARAQEALNHVGLGDRLKAWPATLSGGQRQRVALARALVSRPQALALDEPLGALDALTRIEMQRLIEDIWRTEGFTALLVTHDVSEALMMADRLLLIEDGRIGLDVSIDLPRPRRRDMGELARLEEQILDRLLEKKAA